MSAFAYFSVIEWPPTLPEERRSEFLSRALGMDRYLARQAVLRGVPQVIARVDAKKAARAVAALRQRQGLAFAPTEAQLASRPAALPARQLIAGQGSTFMARPHRGDPLVFDARDIVLMVRASLRSSVSRDAEPGPRTPIAGAYLVGGMAGVAIASALDGGAGPARESSVALTEVMDIHLQDGRSVRFDGRRFSFDVLPKRGLTDRDNMDTFGVLLAEKAPRALVDLNFQSFRCPPDVVQSYFLGGPGGVRRRSQHGAFDFYSVWAALMYTALMGG